MKKRAMRLRKGRGNPKVKGGGKGRGLPRKVKNGYKVRNRIVPFGKLAKKWQTALRKSWRKTSVLNNAAMKYMKTIKILIKDRRRILKEKGAKWILRRQREQFKAREKAKFEGDVTKGQEDWYMMADQRILTADELYYYN